MTHVFSNIEAFRLRLQRARQSGATEIRLSLAEADKLLQDIVTYATILRTDMEAMTTLIREIKKLNERLDRMEISAADGGNF
jgi:phosphoketolase